VLLLRSTLTLWRCAAKVIAFLLLNSVRCIRLVRYMNECIAYSREHLKCYSRCDLQAIAWISTYAIACGQRGGAETKTHLSGNRRRAMQPESKPWPTPTGKTTNRITAGARTVWNLLLQWNINGMTHDGMTNAAQRKVAISARSTEDAKYALNELACQCINVGLSDNQRSRCALWVVERENNKLDNYAKY